MEITLFQPLFLQASDTAPISSFAASSLNSFGNARRYHPVLLTIPEPLLSILGYRIDPLVIHTECIIHTAMSLDHDHGVSWRGVGHL